MKKNIIIVTGGAGFVGSNLIELMLKKTNLKIISLDNYSCGIKKNHIKNKRVSYLNGDTRNIDKILKKKKRLFIQFFILANLLEFIRVF
jgi:UDP-glucose 4-epimerase